MRLLLLHHYDVKRSFYVVHEDAVEAAKVLCKRLGLADYFYEAGTDGKPDRETPISVNGSWLIRPGLIICEESGTLLRQRELPAGGG